MRALIIAIDSLEYTLIEKLNLRNIKQKEYGKVTLPQTKLLTPLLWATFISGTTKHGVTSFTVRRNPVIKVGGGLLQKVGVNQYAGPRHFLRKTLLKLGLFTSPVDRHDLKIKTIFDHAKNPVAISIPAYNEWESIHLMRLKYPFTKLIEKHDEKEIERCIETNWKIFHKKLEYTMELLDNQNWDLLMVHFLILDTIGHLYWNKPWKIKEAYRFMNIKIGQLSSKIKDQWILIISDHGMKKGTHTNYAFYSSNILLRLKTPKLTDFHNIIIQKLKEKEL
jgi:hypothetical protein